MKSDTDKEIERLVVKIQRSQPDSETQAKRPKHGVAAILFDGQEAGTTG
jgi:hypothetical protein